MILCVSLTGGISKGALVRNTLHGTPLFMMRVKSVARAMVKATAMVGASENTHDIGSHNLTCLRTFCSDPSSSGSGSNTVPTNTEARKHLHPHSQIVPLPPVVFVLGGPGSGKGTQSEVSTLPSSFILHHSP